MPMILVRDRREKPVPNTKVFVKWKDGTSTVYTDEGGAAELGTNGYIEYVEIKGEKKQMQVRVEGNESYLVKLNT